MALIRNRATATPSLRRQLAIRLVLGLAIFGVVIVVGAWIAFLRFQLHLSAQALDASSERLIAAVRHGNDGDLFLDQSRVDPVFNRPLSGEYFLIRFADTQWRSRSLWDSELLLAEQPVGRQQLTGPAGQRLLVHTRDYQRYAQQLHVTVASNYSPLQREFLHALMWFVALWLLALLLTLGVLLRWLRSSLQPLEQARHDLASIQAGELQWLSTDAPEELQALLQEINDLLGQTRESVQRSRHALGNFSHTLKTPLAVLSNLVERDELRAQPQLHGLLRTQIEQLSALVTRELSRARSAADSGAFEPFRPGESLPMLFDALTRAHDRKLRAHWDASGLDVVPLDRSDVVEILGNALDNAWKWARSEVSVRIASSVSHWQIDVEDDGPGIADATERQRVLMRGQRLDESTAGQGLGLSIIADTVATYGGSLALDQSTLGGLGVRIRIPKRLAAT